MAAGVVAGPAEAAELIRRCAAAVAAAKADLIALDAAIGDADHGESLDRGMRATAAALAGADAGTPAAVLKTVATTLISTVGGTAGPLYGTAFLRASVALGDRPTVGAVEVVAALRAARDGVAARGRAVVGDKTMLDAWDPAATAAQAALDGGAELPEVLSAAADAAERGRAATVPLVARKGRASYLGVRSAGHADPGATSTALLLRTAADLAATCAPRSGD